MKLLLSTLLILIAVLNLDFSSAQYRGRNVASTSETYGSYCNLNLNPVVKCDSKFECLNSKCSCKSTKHQVYDEKSNECKSLVGGPCSMSTATATNQNPSPSTINCIDNAICVNKGYYEACECKPYYVENFSGKCSLGVGSDCSSSQAPGADNQCDATLTCRNGKCDCADELEVYDMLKKKCRGLIGASCKTTLQRTAAEDDDDDDYCVEKAHCVVANSKLRGRCACKNAWDEWSDRFCERFEEQGNELNSELEPRYQTTEDYRQKLRFASTTTLRPDSAKRYYRRGGQRSSGAPTTTTVRSTVTVPANRHVERTTPATTTTTQKPAAEYITTASSYTWSRQTARPNYVPDNCPKSESSDCSYENCKLTGCTDEKICCPKPCGGNWCVRGVR